MTCDTIFRFSSLAKPIVADADKLRLDDSIIVYLPDFKLKLADSSMPDITIHHFLTHTSGLNTHSILRPTQQAARVNR